MQVSTSTACSATYEAHDRDRAMCEREFRRRLVAEPGFAGEKLDVGCGGNLPQALSDLRDRIGVLDGVDPSDAVRSHPLLRNRWMGTFESANIPSAQYDLAYAYNVMEHIEAAGPFLTTLRRVLKPGGAFWAFTPHALHPFARAVRIIERLGLKHGMAAKNAHLNDYPAYYRLNSKRRIAAAARVAGFSKLEVVYVPCLHWDMYFPTPVRFLPHLYDRLVGVRFRPFMLLLAYRLE